MKYVGSHENLLNLMMFVGDSIFEKINDFACYSGRSVVCGPLT